MKERTIEIDPMVIRFTHARIRPQFSGNQYLLSTTISQLSNKEIPITDVPMIQVMFINGEYYSMNNRRLYCFKELKKMGVLTTINARIKNHSKKEEARYTPTNCSLEAKLFKTAPSETSKDTNDDVES